MMPKVLEAVLTPEQRQAGFWLCEEEDFLHLYHAGDLVATFSSKGATVQSVRAEADQCLERGG